MNKNHTNTPVHRGEVAKMIVLRSGMKMTAVAVGLGISRNTLYNKFENPNLENEFLAKLGAVIGYKFSLCFDNFREDYDTLDEEPILYIDRAIQSLLDEYKEYVNLLENHSRLLSIFFQAANKCEDPTLKKEIHSYFGIIKRVVKARQK